MPEAEQVEFQAADGWVLVYFDDTGHRACPDGRPFGATFFDDVRFPVTAYCFSDDDIATPDNVPPMLDLLANATVTTRWFSPADLGLRELGHLGFFRELGRPLWSEALERLRTQAHAPRSTHLGEKEATTRG